MTRTYRYAIAGIALAMLTTNTGKAMAPTTPPRTLIQTSTRIDHEHPDLVRLRQQMTRHPELPPISFWLAVARCETGHGLNGANHWTRASRWPRATTGGALGIHVSAWAGYGGHRFAIRPGKASMWAQIIIANRIGFLGHQTKGFRTWEDRVANRPFYRPSAGFGQGWGGTCRKQWVKDNG